MTNCLRHPDKKVKYFCESDVAFLCSRCVLSHTGSGHLIQEYKVDLNLVRSDLNDVKSKYQNLLDESESIRLVLDTADRKLADMCHKQSNKLEIAYRSMIKALESKRRELLTILRDFYSDQRQKVSFDR